MGYRNLPLLKKINELPEIAISFYPYLFCPTSFDLATGFICKDALASSKEEHLIASGFHFASLTSSYP